MQKLIVPITITFALLYCSPTALFASQNQEPPLQLAKTFQQNIDLSEYRVSEKLDGVRAYWNGEQLLTRRGNIIQAPEWFTAPLPDIPLDGELWIGRDQFARVSGIVRKHSPIDHEWQFVKFMVFDLPDSLDIFDNRYQQLSVLIEKIDNPQIQLVQQFRVTSQAQIDSALNGIIAIGGEGLMLHRGSALYQAKRTDDLLKLKPFEDAEARVIAHLPGKGQFSGKMGALLVELDDGTQFKIGTGFSVEERENPPEIGALITYRYRGMTKNDIPRFASFMRVREEF
jgi:DNA ligase 1